MENTRITSPWLEWAMEIQSIAQCGLAYSENIYDIERFERLRDISAEMLSWKTDIPKEKVKDIFCSEKGYQTPKIDTRGAIIEDEKILLVQEDVYKRQIELSVIYTASIICLSTAILPVIVASGRYVVI